MRAAAALPRLLVVLRGGREHRGGVAAGAWGRWAPALSTAVRPRALRAPLRA